MVLPGLMVASPSERYYTGLGVQVAYLKGSSTQMCHEESSMKIIRSRGAAALLFAGAVGAIALAIVLPTSAQQNAKQAKQAGNSRYVSPPAYITGTVTGDKGPEAGVWVIAETNELGTKMIKTVVTDDQGRYLLPELPAVNYQVWVRGYGIQDSKPITAKPSANQVALKVTNAKTPLEAAQVYPGDYWLSLLAPLSWNG
jgi:hypothetical protein